MQHILLRKTENTKKRGFKMDWFIYGYLLKVGLESLITLFFVIIAALIIYLVVKDLYKYGAWETLKDLAGGGRDGE